MQDVRIRLSADTKDAENKVRKLEKELEKIQGIQKSGSGKGNVITKRELEEFKALQDSFKRNYDNYINSMVTQARKMKQETIKLRQAMSEQANTNSRKMYEDKLRELETQKRILEMNISSAKSMRYEERHASQNIEGMKQQHPILTELSNLSKSFLTVGTALLGAKKAWGYIQEGAQGVKNSDISAFNVLNRTGFYGNDFSGARKEMQRLGKNLGFGASDTLGMVDNYISRAGYSSMSNVKSDIRSIQEFSKAYGVDANMLSAMSGDMSKMGAVKEGEQRKFANILAYSIKNTGMVGREGEQVEAVKQLTDVLYSNRVNVTEGDMLTSLNLYSRLAESIPGFRGQKGMDVTTSLNQGITQGSHMMDLLLGWGTQYQGANQRWDFELQKAKGIADPENLMRVLNNIEKFTGHAADSPYGKLILKQLFNLEPNMVEALVSNPEVRKAIQTGEYGKEDLEKIKEVSESSELAGDKSKLLENYIDSNVQTLEEFDQSKEQAKQSIGGFWNKFTNPFKGWYNNLKPGAAITVDTVMGAGKLAGVSYGGKQVYKYGKSFFKDPSRLNASSLATYAAAKPILDVWDDYSQASSQLEGIDDGLTGKVKSWKGAGDFTKQRESDFLYFEKWLKTYNPDILEKSYSDLGLSFYERHSPFVSDETRKDIAMKNIWNDMTSVREFGKSNDSTYLSSQDLLSLLAKFEIETGKQLTSTGSALFQAGLIDEDNEILKLDRIFEEYKRQLKETQNLGLIQDVQNWDDSKLSSSEFRKRFPKSAGYQLLDMMSPGNIPLSAIGNDYVPYDGYITSLHKGEAILTEHEANDWRQGRTGGGAGAPDSKRMQQLRHYGDLLGTELKIIEKREELIDMEKDNLKLKDSQNKSYESESLNDWLSNPLGAFGQSPWMSNIFSVFGGMPSGLSGGARGSSGLSNYQYSGALGAGNGAGRNLQVRRKSNVTAEQLNSVIDQMAVSSEKSTGRKSLLRGQGDAFIKAYEATGIHPVDLLSHAALETGWGTSKIAHNKKNFYGIGAFDASPYASAYGYDSVSAGIIEGAKWISKNYVDRGQDTFQKMRWNGGKHQYATDPLWDTKISNNREQILNRLPASAVSYNSSDFSRVGLNNISSPSKQDVTITFKGKIDGMNDKNQTVVANAIASGITGNKGNNPVMSLLENTITREVR